MDFTPKVRDSILDPRVVWDILKVLCVPKAYIPEMFCPKSIILEKNHGFPMYTDVLQSYEPSTIKLRHLFTPFLLHSSSNLISSHRGLDKWVTTKRIDSMQNLFFQDIAASQAKRGQLEGLLLSKNASKVALQEVGITFGRPQKMQLGSYQLTTEISHIHRKSNRRCAYEGPKTHHPPLELYFNRASYLEYGFHKLNP